MDTPPPRLQAKRRKIVLIFIPIINVVNGLNIPGPEQENAFWTFDSLDSFGLDTSIVHLSPLPFILTD